MICPHFGHLYSPAISSSRLILHIRRLQIPFTGVCVPSGAMAIRVTGALQRNSPALMQALPAMTVLSTNLNLDYLVTTLTLKRACKLTARVCQTHELVTCLVGVVASPSVATQSRREENRFAFYDCCLHSVSNKDRSCGLSYSLAGFLCQHAAFACNRHCTYRDRDNACPGDRT